MANRFFFVRGAWEDVEEQLDRLKESLNTFDYELRGLSGDDSVECVSDDVKKVANMIREVNWLVEECDVFESKLNVFKEWVRGFGPFEDESIRFKEWAND